MIHREWFVAPREAIVEDALPAPTNQWVLVCEVTDDEDGFLFAELFGWDPGDAPGRGELEEMIDGYAGAQVTWRLCSLGYRVAPPRTADHGHF